MNFYMHHIGDYAQATAHLSFVEDAAYSRLMRKYYAEEKPLPAELKAVQRLVGARTKEERAAVEAVLAEFFELQADGWHNKRCDEELILAREKTADSESRKDNERERQRRHRERRKELFDALRAHGHVPAWDTTTEALQAMLSRVTGDVTGRDCNGDSSLPVTRDATANHKPLAINQNPEEPPVVPLAGGRRKAGTSCPENFTVGPELWAWALEVGVPEDRIEPETAQFLEHHIARDTRFVDWVMAWRTWMRNSLKFGRKSA